VLVEHRRRHTQYILERSRGVDPTPGHQADVLCELLSNHRRVGVGSIEPTLFGPGDQDRF
jgi:hypothetical protein